MNILYFSAVDISLPNGPGVNENEFVQNLSKQSQIKNDKVYFLLPKTINRVNQQLCEVYWYSLSRDKYGLFPFNIFRIYPVIKIIKKIIRTHEIDLIVIRINKSIVYPILYILNCRHRYVIKTLGNEYSYNHKPNNIKQKLYLIFYRKVIKLILKRAAIIDVCTPQLKNLYVSKYDLSNIYTIENTVNTERFKLLDKEQFKEKLGFKKFDPIIGYCGGCPSKRGAKQLVRIAPKLIKKNDHTGVIIIGEDHNTSLLKKISRELGIHNNVVFMGIVDYHILDEYINCFDVGIALDTVDRVNIIGNSSQKIRQYIACGVPAICPVGTNKEIVSEGFAYPVEPDNLDDIYGTIIKLIKANFSKNEGFRKNAHQYASEKLSVNASYEKRYQFWSNIKQQ